MGKSQPITGPAERPPSVERLSPHQTTGHLQGMAAHAQSRHRKPKNKTNEGIQQNRNRLTDIENKLVDTSGKGEGGKGKIGVWN